MAAGGWAYVNIKMIAFRMVEARRRTLKSAGQGHFQLHVQCQHVFRKFYLHYFNILLPIINLMIQLSNNVNSEHWLQMELASSWLQGYCFRY